MRKLICILLTAFLFAAPVLGAEVDEYAAPEGMGRSWYQGYAPTIRSNQMTIHLPLKAEGLVGPVTVSIELEDPNVYLLAAQSKPVTVNEKNGIYPVKLTLSLKKDRRSGDYPAVITVKNGEKTETIPYVIRIRDGYDSFETLAPVISDVRGELEVGSEGFVHLTIENPTSTLSMTEGVLTVTEPGGQVLMSGSDRFEFPEVLPGKSIRLTVPMTVLGNADIRAHTLQLKLRYRVLGAEQEWTESFTVPVTQAIRLEPGGISAPSAIAGELADVSLPLMNMGRGELHNVLVKLELPGAAEEQSVLVGTLAPGETKQAKLTYSPAIDALGRHSGTLTVSCEDAYGNQNSQDLEFSVTVDEPLPELPDGEPEEAKKVSPGTIALSVLCVLLIIALVTQGWLLTAKLHKLEEERL